MRALSTLSACVVVVGCSGQLPPEERRVELSGPEHRSSMGFALAELPVIDLGQSVPLEWLAIDEPFNAVAPPHSTSATIRVDYSGGQIVEVHPYVNPEAKHIGNVPAETAPYLEAPVLLAVSTIDDQLDENVTAKLKAWSFANWSVHAEFQALNGSFQVSADGRLTYSLHLKAEESDAFRLVFGGNVQGLDSSSSGWVSGFVAATGTGALTSATD